MVFLEFLCDPFQGVAVGIVGFQLQFYTAQERVDAHKLTGIGPHLLLVFLEGLLLADKGPPTDITALAPLLAQLLCLGVRHIIIQHHRNSEVLLHIYRQVMSGKHREYHHP